MGIADFVRDWIARQTVMYDGRHLQQRSVGANALPVIGGEMVARFFLYLFAAIFAWSAFGEGLVKGAHGNNDETKSRVQESVVGVSGRESLLTQEIRLGLLEIEILEKQNTRLHQLNKEDVNALVRYKQALKVLGAQLSLVKKGLLPASPSILAPLKDGKLMRLSSEDKEEFFDRADLFVNYVIELLRYRIDPQAPSHILDGANKPVAHLFQNASVWGNQREQELGEPWDGLKSIQLMAAAETIAAYRRRFFAPNGLAKRPVKTVEASLARARNVSLGGILPEEVGGTERPLSLRDLFSIAVLRINNSSSSPQWPFEPNVFDDMANEIVDPYAEQNKVKIANRITQSLQQLQKEKELPPAPPAEQLLREKGR